jgi:hypothetical protein
MVSIIEKTRGRQSRATVPLRESILQIPSHYKNKALLTDKYYSKA